MVLQLIAKYRNYFGNIFRKAASNSRFRLLLFQKTGRSWSLTVKQINTVHETVVGFRTHRIKLLPGGLCDLSAEVHVLSVLCVICGKALTLALWRCQSGTQHAWNSGRGRHPWRTGPWFACCTKTHYPAWCPPHPRPFTLSHPYEPPPPLPQVHPTLLVPLRRLLLFQLIRSMHGGTMAVLSTRKPGMCLNVAGRVPLFPQSVLCVPCFPRERDRDSECIGGCVNTEGGDRKGMWWQWELRC